MSRDDAREPEPPQDPIDATTADHRRVDAAILGRDDAGDPFVAAVRATHMPIVITDPRLDDNPVVYANDAFCRLTGYAREEIVGRNCRFLQGPDTNREDVAKVRDAVAARCSLEIDLLNHRKGGEPFWNRLRLAPVHDADGTLKFYVANQFDVTLERERVPRLEDRNAALMAELGDRLRAHEAMAMQRHEAEQQLSALAATLEAQVAARTAELMQAEEALRQAQKMEAVGQLTGGIAHDFNNLLAGMSASLEILERRLADGRVDDLQPYIATARGAVRRAASLTQRLLAFSRRQALDPKPVDVNRLVGGMEELVRRTVGPAVAVEVRGAAGLWPTLADPAQLESALLNLCINARDAMAEHGGRLTIATANGSIDDRDARPGGARAGPYVSLCVTDTGTGMPPEVIARAFDPFFTTKPPGGGTGLGLSMVYGFVRQSGGDVRIESEVGDGTTVRLYLPRYAESAAGGDAAALGASAPGEGEGDVEGESEVDDHGIGEAAGEARRGRAGEPGRATLLLIEDEATIRELLEEVLCDAGYRVLAAPDGPSGLRLAAPHSRIDLLLTDVGLPGGMDGRQVADALRAVRPGLKTLFVTGFADNAAVGGERLPPGMEILSKPFDLTTLSGRIRSMLER